MWSKDLSPCWNRDSPAALGDSKKSRYPRASRGDVVKLSAVYHLEAESLDTIAIPSRSAQNMEYLAFSEASSITTSSRLPVLLRAWPSPARATSNKGVMHLIVFFWAVVWTVWAKDPGMELFQRNNNGDSPYLCFEAKGERPGILQRRER